MRYRNINKSLSTAYGEVKMEKVEHKYGTKSSSFKATGYKKMFNKAQRNYNKAIVKLSLEGIIWKKCNIFL